MRLATLNKDKVNVVIEAEKESDKTAKRNHFPCLAIGSEQTKFEQFKAASNYLLEPLASELKNESDHFTNDAVQLLKFHGSYQQDNRENRKKGSSKDWQLMLRLRSPAGKIPAALFIALDDLSNRLGNGTLRATTRQAFQMHGIRKENIREVIGTIVRSLGSTLAACGDINRNVMAPAAPYDSGGYPAARKLAKEIADLLTPIAAQNSYLDLWADGDLKYSIRPNQRVKNAKSKQKEGRVFSGNSKEPLYGSTYMPRKFKCAVTVPGDNSVDLLTHDIGLVAFTKANGELEGCNIYVGGGMGRNHNNEQTFARTADSLGYVESENVLELVQSILALQRDYGDRKTRRHARMKYLIHEMGIEWFKKELTTNYFSKSIGHLHKEPCRKLEDYMGWHRQSHNLWFVGIPLLSGRLKPNIKQGIRSIVEKYQLDIRLTPNQDLLLCNIGKHQKASVKREIKLLEKELAHQSKVLKKHAIACPALPLCGLAITEAERVLPNVLDRIEILMAQLNINDSILIRMTGCPNGCARPYMAEMGLVGSGLEHYQLWLGGTPNLERIAKPYIERMPLEKLEETIKPLLSSWKNTKGKISFGDHVECLGEEKVKLLLAEGLQAP